MIAPPGAGLPGTVMIGSLGVSEIIFILVLALLVFGPKRLPEIGRTIGKGLAEFRRASNDLKRTINTELALEEDDRPQRPGPARIAPAGTQLRLDGAAGEEPQPPATVVSGPAAEVAAMMEPAPEPAPAAAEQGAPVEAPAASTPAPSPPPIEPV
jgi:TatA/E family protein of Tat protein translocase